MPRTSEGNEPIPHLDDYDPFDPALLPPVVAGYIEKHAEPEQREATVDLFASEARVVDEGIEYSGIDAIRGWLTRAASQYTYTTTPLGQGPTTADRWVVIARLEGNSPGGVAELRYRIAIEDGRITELVIAP